MVEERNFKPPLLGKKTRDLFFSEADAALSPGLQGREEAPEGKQGDQVESHTNSEHLAASAPAREPAAKLVLSRRLQGFPPERPSDPRKDVHSD